MAALALISAGSNVMSGIFGMEAADAEAKSLRSQAALLTAESEADIARYKSETEGFKAEQSVKYLKAGVTLSGSPLEILDETTRVASENISAIRARSAAQSRALISKGKEGQLASRLNFLKGMGDLAVSGIQAKAKLGSVPRDSSQPTSSFDYKASSKMNLGFGGGGSLDLERGY